MDSLLFADSVSVAFLVHFWLVMSFGIAFLALIAVNLNRATRTANQLMNVQLHRIEEYMELEGRSYLIAKTSTSQGDFEELGYQFTFISKAF